ncbi:MULTISPECIES: exopolysaccharide production repressor protein [Rhizobium]|uniref:Membrane protein n=1 Tax=Rhizobium favelukesii TaxID=348824 RepID=W6RN22_9HYPH|nr:MULTISPECIES: exopolysaccharide production repressor protein [Rhizobium]MCA0805675.1 exopolysaccharide production repressor protein [Rhizobium sp. T1473]MCS0463703.1 exopolysaccharide production repressor protein [Rhizobium favelukesii]UFS78994.1 exopolysaccharide production repressor protein [Rhizobium sp. T136]CDM62477.1 putative membrane protein [Rhizobium favelukesii]
MPSSAPHVPKNLTRGIEQGFKSDTTKLARFTAMMRAPGVYVRMLLVVAAFCLFCYLHYDSVTTTLYYGLICLVLMQVGYVGGVLYLIWHESAHRRGK